MSFLSVLLMIGALSILDVDLVAQCLAFRELEAPNFAFTLFCKCLKLWSLFFFFLNRKKGPFFGYLIT